jgi:hypothetical protein
MLKGMYAVFLGLTIVTFVGVGVATFYPSPDFPEPQAEFSELEFRQDLTAEEAEELADIRKADEAAWDEYSEKENTYNRNVAIVLMVAAISLLAVSFLKTQNLSSIREGLLLGGIFTLFYSLMRGIASGDDIARFLVVTAGLVVAIWVGMRRFRTAEE